tara:strand:+ start:642 stop:1175 length:534 start_codon:yes stop_codon:yes gene_type:complete
MDISINKNSVDNNFIQNIIDIGQNQELQNATVAHDTFENNKVRSTKISWIADQNILLAIKDKILDINKNKNWNYNLTGMFPFQYSVYNKDDHYDWHVDKRPVNQGEPEKKLSFSLMLNNDYKGGELEFKDSDESISLSLNKGDMVIFPSDLLHRVKPVLDGTRISLVGWLIGNSNTK